MKTKPHITRCDGWWVTSLLGDVIFADATLDNAFISARVVWRHQ